jgi:hypothetical protein
LRGSSDSAASVMPFVFANGLKFGPAQAGDTQPG